MKKLNHSIYYTIIIGYIIILITSEFLNYTPGIEIGKNLISFTTDLLKILPCAFILIGLFEVWIKADTIERNFGKNTKLKGHIWAILLAGTTVGGMYVAFPAAHSLHRKGAKRSIIFTYLGASAICRIPMTVFEASFLGLKFTLIRLIISIPLVVLSSIYLDRLLQKSQ